MKWMNVIIWVACFTCFLGSKMNTSPATSPIPSRLTWRLTILFPSNQPHLLIASAHTPRLRHRLLHSHFGHPSTALTYSITQASVAFCLLRRGLPSNQLCLVVRLSHTFFLPGGIVAPFSQTRSHHLDGLARGDNVFRYHVKIF